MGFVPLITVNGAMEGHVHRSCVQCCLGDKFLLLEWLQARLSTARKAVNGMESKLGAPDWWMFYRFGRWLFKRASSNEKRFLEKTPSSNVFGKLAVTCT